MKRIWAYVLGAFLVGMVFGRYQWFPYPLLVGAKQMTLRLVGLGPKPVARIDFFEDTLFKRKVKCPKDALVVLTFGQSNSANHLMGATTALDTPAVTNFFNGQCYKLEDPVLGATGSSGSLWTQFGQKLYRKTRQPVILVTHGVGGSQIREWLPEHPFGYFKRMMKNTSQLKAAGLQVSTVVFHQGEYDAFYHTPPEVYERDVNRVFSEVQDQLEGEQRFLLFGVSKCYRTPEGVPELIAAQRQVAETRKDTQFVYSTDELSDLYRYDGCHFNHHGVQVVTDELLKFF